MRLRSDDEGRYFKAFMRYLAGLRSDVPWRNKYDITPERKAQIENEARLVRSALTRKGDDG
jgi:hypothetical protein